MRNDGIVERRGVELDVLHVLRDGLRPVAHGDAVAGSHHGIGRGRIDVAATAGSHYGELRQHGFDRIRRQIEHIGAEAGDAPRVARDELAQVMLRQQVDGVVPFQQGDVGMTPHRSHQRTFDLGARQVLVVQDAVLRVAPLAVQLEPPVGRLVEARAPGNEVPDQLRHIVITAVGTLLGTFVNDLHRALW